MATNNELDIIARTRSEVMCRITHKGHDALEAYEQGLRRLFTEQVPENDKQEIG